MRVEPSPPIADQRDNYHHQRQGQHRLKGLIAERLAELAISEGNTLAADVVVPVPLHRDRERERGYNQAALISKPSVRCTNSNTDACHVLPASLVTEITGW